MISTFLVAHPWLPDLLLLAVVTAGPVLAFAAARSARELRALLVLALLPVAALTLSPAGTRPLARCWVEPDALVVHDTANVALFVLPVLFAGVLGRRPWVAAGSGVLLSAAIELVQLLLPALGRSCDAGDLVANGLGSLTGATLAAFVLLTRRAAANPARVGRWRARASRW